MAGNLNSGAGAPLWRDGEDLCALADGDRHLGHIVNDGEWHAFDAIHPNHASHGFRHLGTFGSMDEAKAAVERAVSERQHKARSATSVIQIN